MTHELPESPTWLTDEASIHWPRLVAAALDNKTYSPNYDMTLGILCESIATMQHLQEQIRKEGLTVPGASGNVKAHPALRQLENCRAHVFKQLGEFGLTAKSRKHVREEKTVDPDNPFAQFDKA